MKEIEMKLPRFGYTVVRREKEIDRDRVASYLTRKRQRKITKAVLGDQTVAVEQTIIRCPRCGKETPAYPEFLDFRADEEIRFLSKREIAEWSDRQFRMFEKKPSELRFCEIALPEKRFVCPACGMASEKSNGEYLNVRIRKDRKKISVLLLLDVKDLFTIPWVSSLQIGSNDLYESLTFNRRNRRIYLTIEDANGVRFATRDITSLPIAKNEDDPVIKAFLCYKPISRAVKRGFKEKNFGESLYYTGNWNLSRCFLMLKMFGRGPLTYLITIFYRRLKIELLIMGDDVVLSRASFINDKQ